MLKKALNSLLSVNSYWIYISYCLSVSLNEFISISVGDDRNIVKVFVSGNEVISRT